MTRKSKSGESPMVIPRTQGLSQGKPRPVVKMADRRKTTSTAPEAKAEKDKTRVCPVRQAPEMSSLPWWECRFYLLCWCLAAMYSCYNVFIVSRDYEDDLNKYDFTQGWRILGRRKDMSNFEWDFWSEWFLEMLPWLVGHILLGQLVRWKGFKYRQPLFLVYGLVMVTIMLGPRMVVLLLSHCILVYTAAAWTGSAVLVWAVSLACLSTLNFDPFTTWMKALVDNDPLERRYYLMLFTLAMLNLRYTSFSHEWCMVQKQQKSSAPVGPQVSPGGSSSPTTTFRLSDMLTFCFYLPLMFTGPLMTYDQFYQQLSSPLRPWTRVKVVSLVVDTARVLSWGVFCELILHYFYFNSIQLNTSLLGSLPLWALAGVGYCQGQFFMVKYVVMFGLPRSIARLDQLQPPPGPKCISRIYLYSEMWKYFDQGLYAFMKRHIYIPLGGSQKGIIRQLLASLCCFLFVYYWHGAEDYLLLWVMLNFLGVTMETLASQLSTHPAILHIQTQWLSPACRRRLHAVLAIPLHAMSTVAIFTFFGGKTVGKIFYDRLLLEGWPTSTLTVAFVLYCLIQTSIEIKRWESKKKLD